ncbi:MAG: DUF881 domain-containing protein [Eubacteriales bacterium]|nr:DUF881 domain-containing protein [Eubacteriales bacterium]
MKNKLIQTIVITLICILLGILISLQLKNVNEDNVTESNLEEIQYKLIDYANKNAELNTRNAELYQYISQLENNFAEGNAYIDSIIKEKERIAIFAGLREVKNYGVAIEISCSAESLIRDSVIRTFVNDLRALGAQAISVNDERLVATSEIRATSSSIIINGNGYNRQDKFIIKAITDPIKEAYVLSYLETLKKSVLSDATLRNDQYDIRFQAVQELIIPALSEDSLAFKIDLLTAAPSES